MQTTICDLMSVYLSLSFDEAMGGNLSYNIRLFVSTVVFVLPEFNKYLDHYRNFVIREFVILTIAMVLFNNII